MSAQLVALAECSRPCWGPPCGCVHDAWGSLTGVHILPAVSRAKNYAVPAAGGGAAGSGEALAARLATQMEAGTGAR